MIKNTLIYNNSKGCIKAMKNDYDLFKKEPKISLEENLFTTHLFKNIDGSIPVTKNQIVKYGEYKISDTLLYSQKYHDCCGLILFDNHGLGSLSHMDYNKIFRNNSICSPPNIYVNNMVDEFKSKTNEPEKIFAIVFAGLTSHFNEIVQILNHKNIPVNNYFLDRFADKNLSNEKMMLVSKRREVIINPKDNSVVIKVRNSYGDNIFKLN